MCTFMHLCLAAVICRHLVLLPVPCSAASRRPATAAGWLASHLTPHTNHIKQTKCNTLTNNGLPHTPSRPAGVCGPAGGRHASLLVLCDDHEERGQGRAGHGGGGANPTTAAAEKRNAAENCCCCGEKQLLLRKATAAAVGGGATAALIMKSVGKAAQAMVEVCAKWRAAVGC